MKKKRAQDYAQREVFVEEGGEREGEGRRNGRGMEEEAKGKEGREIERRGRGKKEGVGREEGTRESFFPGVQSFGANSWACRVARRISFTIISICLEALGIRLEWLLENTFKFQ